MTPTHTAPEVVTQILTQFKGDLCSDQAMTAAWPGHGAAVLNAMIAQIDAIAHCYVTSIEEHTARQHDGIATIAIMQTILFMQRDAWSLGRAHALTNDAAVHAVLEARAEVDEVITTFLLDVLSGKRLIADLGVGHTHAAASGTAA